MKNIGKQALSLILLTSMLATLSCGDSFATVEETTVETEETTVETTEGLSDELPEMDFEGYKFKMFIRGDDNFIADMYAEAENGDLMNDAVYNRNAKIGERFNIEYEMIRSANVYANDAREVILAGEDAYDIIVGHARTISAYAHRGEILDWNENLTYINLDKPWWNQDSRASLSVCNKLYTCSGDILYQNLGAANGLYFNKQLFEDLKITGIYDTVKSGKWTFDKFAQYAKMGSADLNGDSKFDAENDRFGYITSWWKGPIQVLYTGGQRICAKNDKDELVLTLNTERTVDIFEKFFELTDSDAGYIFLKDGATQEMSVMFAEGRALFYDVSIKDISNLRDMKADFGIIPWPKFDETEEKYYTNVDAGCNLIGVPITATNPERTSVILEALCAEGYFSVVPVFYEVALQTKYSRDDESVQMLDLIRDGRVFDAGYFYDNSSFVYEINSIGYHLSKQEDHGFASFYATHEAKAIAKLDEINEIYRER